MADNDDDELEEESLLETPLDRVEPYGMFKSALLGMGQPLLHQSSCANVIFPGLQQQQPQFYQNLVKVLNPEEEQIVQSVVMQADTISMAAAQAAHVNGGTH